MSGTPPSSLGGSGVTSGPPMGGGVTPAVGVPVSGTVVGVAAPAVGGANIGAASVGSSADHFCLRWNNYQTNMTAVFDQLLQEEVFVDVTLSCEGGAQLRAHKVVLAACSPYFQAVLQNNPCKHPIIILPRDVVFADLRAIIEFVYRGEIDVAQEQINSLLQAADTLKIKGLCEVGDDPTNCPPGFTATPSSRANTLASSSQSSSQQTPQAYTQSNNVAPARGRPPFSRGRYNTAYRPRGRPPLYSRQRFDRPLGSSSRSAPLSRELRESKRIKTEDVDEEGVTGSMGTSGEVSNDPHHRLHHSHYQSSQHNGGAAATTNHAPPAAHTHHGPPAPQAHPPLPHPPAAHGPPPLPELGPSVVLPPPDETAGTSHGTPDYDSYSYVKTEDHSQTQGHLQDPTDPTGQRMTVTPELLGLMPSNAGSHYSSDSESVSGTPSGRKLWTDEDMEKALDSLRNSAMSLSRAAQVFGIPATTLWQRAHRMGIETPKKEGPNKTWSEHDLAGALEELRSGRLSANRASKEFGIPNSTLYKIARKEGIKLSSPFSAIQPSWNPEDLNRALDAIRGGMSVQKAAQEYGIPTGTLYGRCRREGIELSKYQGVPWSEEDMKDALEAVRVGEMSINQAAIHYNLPYSSLYGRFKRGKYEDGLPHHDFLHQEMTIEHYPGDHQASSQTQNSQSQQQPQQQSQQQQSQPPQSATQPHPQEPTPPPHHSQTQAPQSLPTGQPPDQY